MIQFLIEAVVISLVGGAIGLLLGVHVIALCIEFFPQFILGDSPGVKAVVVIASLLLTFVTALGLVRIGLNLVDGEDAELADLFSCAHLVFNYLIASVLHGILIRKVWRKVLK